MKRILTITAAMILTGCAQTTLTDPQIKTLNDYKACEASQSFKVMTQEISPDHFDMRYLDDYVKIVDYTKTKSTKNPKIFLCVRK